jgi:hypothetical protein
MSNESFQAESNDVRIRRSTTRQFRLIEELIVDVQGLFHMGIYTL